MFACSCIPQDSVPTGFSYPDAPLIIEIEPIQISNCLCGIVQNSVGYEMGGVLIEILDAQTKHRVVATFSDSHGQFRLNPGHAVKDQYLLKFSKPGFNTTMMRVRLDPSVSQKLTVKLQFG
jgi:hypothetical protein